MTAKVTERTLDLGATPTAPAANGVELSQPGSARLAYDGASLMMSANGAAYAAVGGGGAVLVPPEEITYSFVNNLKGSAGASAGMGVAAAFTFGVAMMPLRQRTVTGVRFWSDYVVATDLKACIWEANAGALVASGTAAVPAGAGYHEVDFAAPYALSAAEVGQEFRVTLFYLAGTAYPRATSVGGWVPAIPFVAETYIQSSYNLYGVGDAYPTLVAGAEWYMVEPVFAKVPA